MMESIIGGMGLFMGKVAEWLTMPELPWGDFLVKWNKLVDTIAPWNRIFPLTDLMVIIALWLSLCIAMMIFYTVVLVKSFIPFSGGK